MGIWYSPENVNPVAALPFPSIEGSMGDRKCLQKATPRWKFVAAFGPTPGEESDGHVFAVQKQGPFRFPDGKNGGITMG